MKFTILLILVLALLLLVAPVQAQEVEPADTMLVIDGTTMTLFGAIGLGVLIVVAALLVNQRDMAAKLANSAPPWMETTLTVVAGVMEGLAQQTPTTMDDDLVATIRKEIEAAFERKEAANALFEAAEKGQIIVDATHEQTAPVVDLSEDIPPAGS